MIHDGADKIKAVIPTLLSTNSITSGVTDTSYQSRLIKLTPSVPEVIRSIDIPVVHDPRRMKRVVDESSRGIMVKDSTVGVFGAILDCQDRPKTRDVGNPNPWALLNEINISEEEIEESFAKDDFWIFISRLKTSAIKKHEEKPRQSAEIPFIEKQEVKDCQELECTKELDKVNAFTCDSHKDSDEVVILNETRKANADIQGQSHTSETVLMCKDQTSNSRLGTSGKGDGSKISSPVLADTTSMSENTDIGPNKENASSNEILKQSGSCRTETKTTDFKNQSECAMQKFPELVLDKVGNGILQIPVKIKRTKIKLNLKTFDQNKDTNTMKESVSITSVVKEIPDIIMTDICDKSTCTKKMDLIHENNQCAKSSYTRKRKISHTSIKETNQISTKRRKEVRKRFRTYFGDCVTISEDEEDTHIIQKYKPANLKKRISNESISSNCIEIIKEIQMAVPDSTMEEYNDEICDKESIEDCSCTESEGVTRIESECATQMAQTGILDLLRNMCEADSARMDKDDVLQKNLVTTGIADVIEVHQNTKDLKISTTSVTEERITIVQAKNDSNCATKSSSVADDGRASPILNLDFTEIWNRSDLNTKDDLSQLLHIKINEAYQVAFHGNVISIQEDIQTDANQNVIDKSTNESTNLKGPCEVELNSSHDVNQEKQIDSNVVETIVPNNFQGSDVQKDSKVTGLDNNVDHVHNNTCEAVRKDSQMMDCMEEKVDAQPATVPQLGKLRVLSSAELGSRWCPTPVGTTASDVPQMSFATSTIPDISSKFTTAEISTTSASTASPVIVSVTSVPTFTPLESDRTMFSEKERNAKICSDNMRSALNNIRDHIKKNRLTLEHWNSMKQSTIRTNVNPNLISYCSISSSVLLKELDTIAKIEGNRNFDVVKFVVDEINKEWSENPLSYDEFMYYVPFHYSSHNCKPCPSVTVNVCSRTTSLNQNLQNNSRIPKSTPPAEHLTNFVNTGGAQIRSENPKPPTEKKRSTRSHQKRPNVDPKKSQNVKNNLQPGTRTLPQTAILRNNAPLDFLNAYNTQQMNYAPEMIQTLPQQTGYAQYMGTKPMTQISQPLQSSRAFIPVPVSQYASVTHSDHASTSNVPIANPYTQQSVHAPQVIRTDLPTLRQLVQQPVTKPHENTVHNVNLPTPNQESQYVTYHKPVYNASSVTCQSSQNVKHTVPTLLPYNTMHNILAPNYIPQPVHYSPNTCPRWSNNVPQKQIVPQRVTLNNGFASEEITLPQQMQHNRHYSPNTPHTPMPQEAAGTKVPSSMRHDWNDYSISRYYNNRQKHILLKQVKFFIINCSTYLQQQTVDWKHVQSSTIQLQEFHRILWNHLHKIAMNYIVQVLPDLDTCTNVKNDSAQKMQSTIQESQLKVHLNEVSAAVEEQPQIGNIDKIATPCKENLSKVVEKQSGEVKEPMEELEENTQDKLKNKDEFENKNNEGTTQKYVEQNQSTLEEKNSELLQDVRKPPKQCMLRRYLETTSCSEKQENKEVVAETSKDSSIPQQDAINAHNPKEQREIVSPQPTPVLVTVEISPCNDKVKVITTNTICVSSDSVVEKNDENKTEECHQSLDEQHYENIITLSSPAQDIISEEPTPAAYKVIDLDLDETLSEGSVTHIADVRSIPLDVFEKMGDDCAIVSNNDGEFEEEENKVCLYCSKKSTVVCEICWQAQYCTKACAVSHWNDHFKDCKPSKQVYTEYNCQEPLSKNVHDSASVT